LHVLTTSAVSSLITYKLKNPDVTKANADLCCVCSSVKAEGLP